MAELEARALLLTTEGVTSIPLTPKASSGGTTWQLEAPCSDESPPLARLIVGGQISQALHLRRETCADSTIPLSFEALAWVEGELTVPLHSQPPKVAFLRAPSCGGQSAPSAKIEIPVLVTPDDHRETRFEAPLPAGCRNPVLWAGEFAPVELPRQEFAAESKTQLGSFDLHPGAALLVQALQDSDGRSLPGVQVQVLSSEQLAEAAAAALAGKPAEQSLKSSFTDDRGWVRFFGLPPAPAYVLLHRDGYSPRISNALELEAGREHLIDELTLERPATLEVEVTPGHGEPLQVSATPRSLCQVAAPPSLVEHLPANGGRVVFRQIPPGLWELTLEAGPGEDGIRRILAQVEIELAAGSSALETIELTAGRPGLLTLQGKPIGGRLVFYPQDSSNTDRPLSALALSDGTFEVAAELIGTYRIHVVTEDPRLDLWLPPWTVHDSDERLEIALPDVAIDGTILDPEGVVVPAATVVAYGRIEVDGEDDEAVISANTRSDESGGFSLQGLAPGVWELRASKGTLRSRVEPVDLTEENSNSGLELVLLPTRELQGRVVNALGQPVAGALVTVEAPPRSGGSLPNLEAMTSNRDGTFSLRLPPDHGDELLVSVLAEGHAAWAGRMPVTPEIVVSLPLSGGRLQIEGSSSEALLRSLPYLALIEPTTGGVLTLTSIFNGLRNSTSLTDGVLTIPNLAPGQWELVLLGPYEVNLASRLLERSESTTRLGRFTAAPGRSARIRIPAP